MNSLFFSKDPANEQNYMKSNALEVANNASTCKKFSFPHRPRRTVWLHLYNPGFYPAVVFTQEIHTNLKNACVIYKVVLY